MKTLEVLVRVCLILALAAITSGYAAYYLVLAAVKYNPGDFLGPDRGYGMPAFMVLSFSVLFPVFATILFCLAYRKPPQAKTTEPTQPSEAPGASNMPGQHRSNNGGLTRD